MAFRKKNKSWGSPGIEYGSNQEPYFFNTKGIGPFGLDPAGSAEFQIIPPGISRCRITLWWKFKGRLDFHVIMLIG